LALWWRCNSRTPRDAQNRGPSWGHRLANMLTPQVEKELPPPPPPRRRGRVSLELSGAGGDTVHARTTSRRASMGFGTSSVPTGRVQFFDDFAPGDHAEVLILEGEDKGRWLECCVEGFGTSPGTFTIHVLSAKDGTGARFSNLRFTGIEAEYLRKAACCDVLARTCEPLPVAINTDGCFSRQSSDFSRKTSPADSEVHKIFSRQSLLSCDSRRSAPKESMPQRKSTRESLLSVNTAVAATADDDTTWWWETPRKARPDDMLRVM